MRLFYTAIAILLFCTTAGAQTTQDYAIQLSATTQVSPPSITLKWRPITFASPTPIYNVFRKAKGASSWAGAIASITTGDTVYVDNSVIVDSAYEYQVAATGTTLITTPYGQIYAGIKAPAIHNRGALILLVDSTFTDSCATDITKVMRDINGDGWQVIRHDLSRTLPDTAIKAIIKKDYTNIPNVKAVLILGHLAVPYSGDLNPDAHPDHLGAWPADVYYGCMTGTWTDVTINDLASSNPLDHNIPGDGKWDQSAPPAQLSLQVSRVDVNNMPAFSSTEVQMMRRYLKKAHTYKMDSLNVRRRALMSDNFGIMAPAGEAFATNGWRLTPMVSRDSIFNLPFIGSLADSSFQWAYGCGPGSYTTGGGIGSTANFASAGAVHAIFTMLFGSYFGDWNYQDNFLRAPLCADTPALTSCWAGRPNWFLHHMALGENIGYSTMLTQNNSGGLYSPANYGAGWVHIALMGDLTLRTDYIKQPTNLTITPVAAHGANLSWTISPDPAVIGYYVYRTDSAYGYSQKISPMITGTTFSDTVGVDGMKYYMVRPVKLQSTPSGSYYNLGIGITNSATIDFPAPPIYVATVTTPSIDINIYPNPVQQDLGVVINAATASIASMYIVNISGDVLYPVTKQLNAGQNAFNLNVSSLPAGIYTLCIRIGDDVVVKKWVKL